MTFVKTQDCHLIDIKSQDKDGYIAVKLGFKVWKNAKKPAKGETKKAGIETPLLHLGKSLGNILH